MVQIVENKQVTHEIYLRNKSCINILKQKQNDYKNTKISFKL